MNRKDIRSRKPWLAGFALAAALILSLFSPTLHAASTATFLPGESIAANLRVKISGSTVVTAGAGESAIGTTLSAATTANFVTVSMASQYEIANYVASAAITAGADVYGSASGKVAATVSGRRIGKAITAAAADGDILRVLLLPSDVDRVFLTVPIAAASVDTWAFIADRAYTVNSIKEVHTVAGSDGSAVTLDVRKITADATAPGAAAGATVKELLTTAFDLKSTANTPVTGTLTATAADLNLAAGDRIGFNFAGTLTSLAGGLVLVELIAK
jgi:hypothetical protein